MEYKIKDKKLIIRRLGLLKSLDRKIDQLSLNMEKYKMVDYVYYIEHPKKLLMANFIGGLARGFGVAIGFSILGAVTLYLLRYLVMCNIPGIGVFISEIVKIVQDNLMRMGGNVGG